MMHQSHLKSRSSISLLIAFFTVAGAAATVFSFQMSQYGTSMDASVGSSVHITAKVEEQKPVVNILAFGDMMLDREVRNKINKYGAEYPFLPIKDFLIGNDIVVANAEGPFTDNESKTLGVKNGPLEFTFEPNTLPTLKKLGFTLFSQANNHSLNFGTEGLAKSEENITNSGINWFGDPLNKEPHSYITNIKGQKIAFVGYHEFVPGGSKAVMADIASAKGEGAFVIVYPHWGKEYNPGVTPIQSKYGHAFIDAGADVVLGSHPHVVEPIEIYKGKAIFYSMGNFIFDQASTGPMTEGLSVGLYVNSTDVSYSLFPIKIKNQQASLLSGDDRSNFLLDLAKKSIASDELKDSVKNGVFNLIRD